MDQQAQKKTIKDYFCIQELVPKDVYDRYKEAAWKFLDPLALQCLLIVREGIGNPMTCNDWHKGGIYDERGLRPNTCDIVQKKGKKLYLSAHTMGKGFDFKVKDTSSVDVRMWIHTNDDKFPCKIRLEGNLNGKPISWVHLDTFAEDKNPKVYQFDV
jgi:hypothetical protein